MELLKEVNADLISPRTLNNPILIEELNKLKDSDSLKELGNIWFVSKPIRSFYLKKLGEIIDLDLKLKDSYELIDKNTFAFIIERNENEYKIFNEGNYIRNDLDFIYVCGNIKDNLINYTVCYIFNKSYEDFKSYTSSIIEPIIFDILELETEKYNIQVCKRFSEQAYKDYLILYKDYYLNNVTLESVKEEKRDVIDFSVNPKKIKCKDVLCVYNIYEGRIVKYHMIESSEDYIELSNGDIILWRSDKFKLQSIKNKGLGYINYNYNSNYKYKKYRYLVLLHALCIYHGLNTKHIEKERTYYRCNKNISIINTRKEIKVNNKILGTVIIENGNLKHHISKKHEEVDLSTLLYILDNIAGVYKYSRGSKEFYVESYIEGEVYRAIIQDRIVKTAYKVDDKEYIRWGLYNYTYYEDKEMLSSYNFLVVDDFNDNEIKIILRGLGC